MITTENHSKLNFIRHLGFRITPQRQLVLDSLNECGGHATAKELAELVQNKVPSLNRATVYRTLDFFYQLHLVSKTEFAGQTMYELLGEDPHHHLVCTQCGHVEAVPAQFFEPLLTQLHQNYQFQADLRHLAISGICHGCAANPN